jgi:hypothetical protein
LSTATNSPKRFVTRRIAIANGSLLPKQSHEQERNQSEQRQLDRRSVRTREIEALEALLHVQGQGFRTSRDAAGDDGDGAMIGVMKLLRDIGEKKSTYAFVDDARRGRSEKAVARGIES